MRTRFFYFVMLLALGLGIGATAIARDAKPTGRLRSPRRARMPPRASPARDATRPKSRNRSAMTKCLTCHGDTKAIAQRTANVKPTNPHNSRHYGTEADCNSCHHQHTKSESLCADCHPSFKFKVP